MQKKDIFVGVDVSKKTLDIFVHDIKSHIRVSNDTSGFNTLTRWLRAFKIALSDCWFVMEYTGGYEYRFIQFCSSKGVRFTRIPGLQIKKSMGIQRGKNDKIDSKRIAEYGYEKREKLAPHKLCNVALTRLRILLMQRRGYVNDRKSNENRMKELMEMLQLKSNDPIIKRFKKGIDASQRLVKQTEAEIEQLIKSEETMLKNFKLITSIPGIGPINAWMTIAYTENFTSFTNGRSYAAYIGVVPYEHSSGTSIRGKSRTSHMANKPLKADISMGAHAAVQHDPELRMYYLRRIEKGKKPASVLNEVKFKLVLRMFAVVNKGDFYVKNHSAAA